MTDPVPAAPLLGMYQTSGAFPTPGPSAWPSGPTTNMSATYQAWGQDFATYGGAFITKCNANGLVPFVELEPWHSGSQWNVTPLFSDITGGAWDTWLTGIGSAIAATGKTCILTFAHEFNVSGQYPWSQGMTGSGPGGGTLTPAEWIAGWQYVHDKVNSTAAGHALWMWAPNAWTGGTTIDPSPWWPGAAYVDMAGIDGYPNTRYGASLGTFSGQFGQTVTALRKLGWTGGIFISETNLAQMTASGGESITSFVADMHAAGISGVLEFEDAAWGLPQMTAAQWTEYNNAVAADYTASGGGGGGGGAGGGGSGTLAPVQTATSALYANNATFPAAVTAGNGVVLLVSISGGVASSVSGGTDTWTIVTLVANYLYLCYTGSSAGGYYTVTVTETGGTALGVAAYEVPGPVALDKTAAAGAGPSATWSSGTTAATAAAAEIWIGAVQTNQYAATGPSGWTELPLIGSAGGNMVLSGYQVQTAAGTAVYSGTVTSADYYSAAVVTFRGAATVVALTDSGTGSDALAAYSGTAVALTDAGTGTDALVTALPAPQPPPPSGLVLPQVLVEAGLTAGAPVQAAGTLLLNDPVSGLLDTAVLGTAVSWTGVSAQVLSFAVTRPSTRLAGPLWNYQPGTASILLDNSDGRFDPGNLAGPYVTAGATQLVPMVPVRVRAVHAAVTYPLFSGYADGWLPAQLTYNAGYAELTLPATDAFKVLAGITLAQLGSPEGAGVTTGARIRDILARAGWWTSAEYSAVGDGDSAVQATSLGDTALNLMQAAADSEIGQLYVSGSGAVTFRGRQQILTEARSNTVQAAFGDLPGTVHGTLTELPCAAIGRTSDDTTVANDIQATVLGGTMQEAQDAASIARYLFPRTYARSDLILQGGPDALAWAQWVLHVTRDAADRFDTLAVDPAADPVNLWPQVLGREIGDRIQVWARPAGTADPVSRDCFIAGIAHTWDSATSAWLTTWTLQDAPRYGSFLTLDSTAIGRLDQDALVF